MSKVIVDGVEWQEFLVEFQTQEGTFDFKLFAVDWAHAMDRLEELKATAKVIGDNCSDVPADEPVAFEQWLANQHGDPEEIGFSQALRVAYISGQDSITRPQPAAWVGLTDEEIQEIALELPMDAVRIAEAKLKEKNT